jgi:hypothetical protein
MIASRVDNVPLYKAKLGIETHNVQIEGQAALRYIQERENKLANIASVAKDNRQDKGE